MTVVLTALRCFWRGLRLTLRAARWALGLLLFVFLIQRSTYPMHLEWNAVAVIVTDYKFDYLSWTLDALGAKTAQTLWGQHPFMNEADRSQFVRDYLADVTRARELEAEIDRLYLQDSTADTSALQAERRALRGDLARRQSTVEAILEGQVAAVLVDEGFGTLGQLLPPVAMRFTRMPNLLVVSPRDDIRRTVELALQPMSAEEAARLERQIERNLDVSALIVPLGGMALYPAMIQESGSLPWVVETFAHEWVHHYFFFFPLGLNYFVETGGSRESLIINETVADIFGAEIAERVLDRYYPETRATTRAQIVTHLPQEAFDFGTEMHRTRVTVDNWLLRIGQMQAQDEVMLARGNVAALAKNERDSRLMIAKMEAYMRARQAAFNANGYRIRRINQAYFAFYGGYQGGIPGIGGDDPIGPAVRDIRAASPDLHSFVVVMRGITTRETLLRERDRLLAEADTAIAGPS